jgi:drug/metabolite transporter (DMT)-like permease
MQHSRVLAYVSGVVYSALFGFSFMFTKGALDQIDPVRLIGFRFIIAAASVSLLLLTGKFHLNLRGKNLLPVLAVALFEPIAYFVFETTGIRYSTSSQAGMMIALIPIVVVILSAIFLRERPTVLQVVFVVVSVAGVAFIGLMQESSGAGLDWRGPAALMGAVISAGLFTISSRSASRKFTPFEITFVMMWTAAIVFNAGGVVQFAIQGRLGEYLVPWGNVKVLGPLFYLGFGSSFLAYFLVNYTLSHLPASQASVMANLTTVISIAAGVVLLNEAFLWYHALGAVLILLGVWGTNYFASPEAPAVQPIASAD